MGIRCVRQRRQPLGSSAPWGIAYTVEVVNRMGVTKSVIHMGEYSVHKRRQPIGSSAPWSIAYTVEAVNRMGVTKSVIPMGKYSVRKRRQPLGSSSPWGLYAVLVCRQPPVCMEFVREFVTRVNKWGKASQQR